MNQKISHTEAYSLMSKADHDYMNQKMKELEKVVGDCSNLNLEFYLVGHELFLEILSGEEVRYRLMFNVTKEAENSSPRRKNAIQLSNYNESFKCVDPEGVLIVAKILEGALEEKPPFALMVEDLKGMRKEIVSRESLLEHYMEYAVQALYEYVEVENESI